MGTSHSQGGRWHCGDSGIAAHTAIQKSRGGTLLHSCFLSIPRGSGMSPRPGHTSPSGDTGSAGSRHPPRSRVCRAGSSGGRSSPQHRGRHRWRGGRRSHWHRSSSVHTSFRSGREGTGAGRWGHGSLGCRCMIHPQESTTLRCGTRRAGGSLGPRSPAGSSACTAALSTQAGSGTLQ